MTLMPFLTKNYACPLSAKSPETVSPKIQVKIGASKLYMAMLTQCAFEINALPLARREAACQRLALTEALNRRLKEVCDFITRIESRLKKTKKFRSALPVFQRIKSFCSFKKQAHTKPIFSPALFSYFASIIEKIAAHKLPYIALKDMRTKIQECFQDSALLEMLGLWYICDIHNQEELISFCQESGHIKKIRVCYELGNQGMEQLADALKSNNTLTSIVIWQGRIGDAEVKTLAEALKVNKGLESLELPANQIRDQGARDFAAALKVNQTLKKLSLSGNSIRNEGAKMLAEALEVNQSLTSLSLFCNHGLHAEGVVALANALLVNETLTHLNLGSNDIGKEGLKALQDIQVKYPKRKITLGFAERSA